MIQTLQLLTTSAGPGLYTPSALTPLSPLLIAVVALAAVSVIVTVISFIGSLDHGARKFFARVELIGFLGMVVFGVTGTVGTVNEHSDREATTKAAYAQYLTDLDGWLTDDYGINANSKHLALIGNGSPATVERDGRVVTFTLTETAGGDSLLLGSNGHALTRIGETR